MQAEGTIQAPQDWYDGFFEGEWLDDIALRFEPERAEHEAAFIVERLGVGPGDRVLDLACGHGRIALELARRGLHVTGLDLSPRSLQIAAGTSRGEGLDVQWIRADKREIPPELEFDAIYNVFTSFGYFEEAAENQRVLDGIARALRRGGAFLIDTLNLLGLVGRYQHRLWERQGDVLQLAEHEFDILRGRNRARWTFIRPDGSRSDLVHSVQAYAPHELVAMLARAGLEVEASWGGFDGSELSFASWRTILLARKP